MNDNRKKIKLRYAVIIAAIVTSFWLGAKNAPVPEPTTAADCDGLVQKEITLLHDLQTLQRSIHAMGEENEADYYIIHPKGDHHGQ